MNSTGSIVPLFSSLILAQEYLTRYGMAAYTVLGNIGLLLNIAIFIAPVYRRNSFSLYIFAASLCGLIGLNFSSVPVIYALDHPNPVTATLTFCQLQFYFRHSFNQMMRTFFIFACIDRYAISSGNVRIRSFGRYSTAVRVTICIPIILLLVSIFPTLLRTLENGKCQGRNGLPSIILSVYIAIVVGVIPLFCMLVFGILMLKNLKKIRSHIRPNTSLVPIIHRLHQRDREMMRMLLMESICYISTTAPLAANLVYQSMTQNMIRSSERQQIESFITYFTGTFLIYMNNSLPFWIYVITSHSFRLEAKHLFIRRCKGKSSAQDNAPN